MCLAAFAIDVHPRFPLVVVANRDEYLDRPTAALGWWHARASTGDTGQDILSGRDLRAGGTWLGLSRHGRFALLTNIRAPHLVRADAPSRGAVVTDWLTGDDEVDRFASTVAGRGHNGFNLVAADLVTNQWHWLNSTGQRQALGAGVHGLSNGTLDEPWPKVQQLKLATAAAIEAAQDVDDLARRLFDALGQDRCYADDCLPTTGVPLAVERWLSPAFIRSPDGRYGTRSSTLVITERHGSTCVTHVLERTYAVAPNNFTMVQERLPGWPVA